MAGRHHVQAALALTLWSLWMALIIAGALVHALVTGRAVVLKGRPPIERTTRPGAFRLWRISALLVLGGLGVRAGIAYRST